MSVYVQKFELKMFKSEHLQELMKSIIPPLCIKRNCQCDITVESKWYWFKDKYTIEVTGEEDDLSYIENKLKSLVKF